MADLYRVPVLGNYRRNISPSLGEFDVDIIMEKAAAVSVSELKEMKARSGEKDSCVINMSTSDSNNSSIKMFRQRAQVDTGGVMVPIQSNQRDVMSVIHPFNRKSSRFKKAIKEFFKSVLSENEGWRIVYLGCLNLVSTITLFHYCRTSNSMALTAFTYLTVFDFLSLLTCFLSIWISLQNPSSNFSFGFARVEVLAVFASTMLAMFGALFIIKESIERIFIPPVVYTEHVMLVTFIALVVHLFVTYGTTNKPFNQVLSASTSNWLQDALMDLGHSICGVFPPLGNILIARVNPFALVALVGAITVVVTTLFIDYNQYYLADTLAAVAIGLLTWATMLPLAIYSGHVLMQTCPPGVMNQLDKCMREALTLDGVLEFRNEHFWTLSFGKLVGSLHVRVRRDADEQLVLAHMTNKLAGHVTDLTIQVFKEDLGRTGAGSTTYAIRPNSPAKPHEHVSRA